MADLLENCACPPEKEGISMRPAKMSNFGMHFWPRVTLLRRLKCGFGEYFIWRFQFWGGKRPQTLLNVYFIASHLVE
jgi:hypothetical protein